MQTCPKNLAESYLNTYGWNFRTQDCGSILTGWVGQEEQSFRLQIFFYDIWLSLQVKPLGDLKIDWESWPEISRFLLEFNDATHMAKVSLAHDGQILLSLDLFITGLSYQQFTEGLGVLAHYAEQLYDQLLAYFDQIGFRYCDSLNILT